MRRCTNRACQFLLTLCLALAPAIVISAQELPPQERRAKWGEPPPQATPAVPDKTGNGQPALKDQSDYYFHKSGRRISFLRKEDTYVVLGPQRSRRSALRTSRIRQIIGTDADLIETEPLGSRTVLRVQPGTNAKSVLDRIRALDPETFLSPVLTNEKGIGSLGVAPSVLVRLTPSADPSKTIPGIEDALSVSFTRSPRAAPLEFEFEMRDLPDDAGEIFALARALDALPSVEWAEPNLIVAPQRTLTPNDPQYPAQWHLHNTGQNGAVVDADIDAPAGWDVSQGTGMVIAIFDDGVDVDHEDLDIWANPGETGLGKETNGIDDDANGYVDDYQGWDFGDDDNDPSPGSGDSHGTAVAGVAGAIGNNGVGVAGSALSAQILPIRSGSMSCTAWGEAMRYAGKYGHVVNNSWGIGGCQSSIDAAISDVANGVVPGAVRGALGTPVLFATGNSASGWEKFTLNGFSGGSYDFEWRFIKDVSLSQGDDTVWLDDIAWPGGTSEDFESDALGAVPSAFTTSGSADWTVVSDGLHARGATGNSAKAGTISNNQQTSLLALNKTIGSGNLSFWVWVSSEYNYDFFEFYVDGTRYFRVSPGQYGVHQNDVGYPASNPDAIAVGASRDGSVGNEEQRSAYSQFGPDLDVVAPSSGGGQGITTTDRTGADGYSATDYTPSFGGTSSATPLVAGVVANILENDPTLSATQLRQRLRDGADPIGPYPYTSDRNDYYGHGRVNFPASMAACGNGILDAGEACDDGNLNSGDCCSDTCQVEPAGTVCRASSDTCDVAETCDGVADTCPVDLFEPITTVCRGAAGVCDAADTCDGASAACPVDAKLTSVCRASSDTCDVAETCDGVADTCPVDLFEPITTVCRAAAGVCDAADTCDGASAACPADAFLADGTTCDDTDACTSPDECQAGVCQGPPITGPPLCEEPIPVPLLTPRSVFLLLAGLLSLGSLITTRPSPAARDEKRPAR